MTTSDTATLVECARAGDLGAFERLVTGHQAMAVGYAFARLGDREAARDAAQDAFVDAYLRLADLREPAAFSGWLRRILFKHCDRQRRRRQEIPTTLEVAAPDVASPPDRLTRAEEIAELRAAIEALPEHERFVVALHYLAETPVSDIAAFLEISVAAVKKRLFSARRRLKGGPMKTTTLATNVSDLSDPVALFLAIRAGDEETVERILARSPQLVDAEERWSDDEALAGGFPLAHQVRPLVLAASLGQHALVERLLACGAPVEGRCACDNGETALWAAVRAGHSEVARLLLEAGASVEVMNGAGVTALDLAAWRGDAETLALLRAHGARDLDRPRAWAEHLGHVEAAHVLGVAEIAPRAPTPSTLHTGIKAVDLLVPLEPGAVVRVHGAAETGLMVLLAELAHAVARQGGTSVWATWRRFPWHAQEIASVAASYGLDAVRIVYDQPEEPLLEHALATAIELRADHPVVALFIFEEEGHAAEVEAVAMRLSGAATITFVVRPWAQVTRGETANPSLGGPYDACIATDPELARRGLYPAIDPELSRSRYPQPPPSHEARGLLLALRRHRAGTTLDRQTTLRAERLEAFLTQPFHAATPITAWLGAPVLPADTAAGVTAILEDEVTVAPEALRYCGALDEIAGSTSRSQPC